MGFRRMRNQKEYAKTHTQRNGAAAHALASAITSSRTSPAAPLAGQVSGRLDHKRISRIGTGDLRLFSRPDAPTPDKVRLTILLDASRSMNWLIDVPNGHDSATRADIAAQTTRDLAEATDLLPWVHADAIAFTSLAHNAGSNVGGSMGMFPLWESGQDTGDIDAYGTIPMYGTEEGYALAYAGDELIEARKQGEQCLIVLVGDGEPDEARHVRSVVKTLARRGVPVVSVALTEAAAQPAMYGADNVIRYRHEPRALARAMAGVIGRVI